MLIKFNPKVEHLKCVVLTPKEGLNLTRTMVHSIYAHSSTISSIEFNKTGSLLLSSSIDGYW